MVNKLMKMAGYSSRKKFEEAYPTEQSFLEAFPQARPMMEQFKKQGGATDGIAFPQAPGENRFFNYGRPTPNIPRLFQQGGAQGDPFEQVIMAVAQQMQVDPQQIMQMLQQSPDMLNQLQAMAQQDPQQAAQALAQALQGAGQQDQMAEEQMMAEDQGAAQAETEQQAMMAYGGNPFMQSPLDRFVYGGMPKYADGGGTCPEGYEYDPNAVDPATGQKGACKLVEQTRWDAFTDKLGDWDIPTLGGLYLLGKGASGAMKGAGSPKSYLNQALTSIEKASPTAGGFLRGVTGMPAATKGKAPKITPAQRAANVAKASALPAGYLGYKFMTAPTNANMPGIISAESDATRVKTPVPSGEQIIVPGDFEYGGGVNPFNYGAFTVPMSYGGGTDAMMGDTETRNISTERINNLMKFIRGGIERSQMEEMMGMSDQEMARYGKSVKKKKG